MIKLTDVLRDALYYEDTQCDGRAVCCVLCDGRAMLTCVDECGGCATMVLCDGCRWCYVTDIDKRATGRR